MARNKFESKLSYVCANLHEVLFWHNRIKTGHSSFYLTIQLDHLIYNLMQTSTAINYYFNSRGL